MATPFKLLRESGLIRQHLIVFALVTAALNGLVTASVGAWLAQTYATHLARRQSVQNIADLIYERRIRAGMVVSSMRRGAEVDELRYRKRAYDEVFVEWNKRIQNNVIQIREVMGVADTTEFERLMQSMLVPSLTAMDACLTKAYDMRLAGQDPLTQIEACKYAELHQFVLDCAKGFTDELYRLTRLRFMPLTGESRQAHAEANQRVVAACTLPASALPASPPPANPSAAPAPSPAPAGPAIQPAPTETKGG